MRKSYLKLTTMVLLLTLVFGITACGSNDNSNTNTGSNTASEVSKDNESENKNNISNVEKSKAESVAETKEASSDDTSLFSFYASMPEDEIVMTIDGVELSLTTTWDEFVTIAAENNWTYDEELAKANYQREVITSNGSFLLAFMNNPTTNINEIWKVYVTSTKVPENYININGINAKTSRDLLATLLEVEVRDEYKDGYFFNEYTTLYFMSGRNTKDNPDVTIERTLFSKR